MYNIQNDIQVPFTTALLNQCHNPFKNNNVKKLMLCNGKESKHQNLVSGWSEEGVVDMQNSEFVTEPDQCKLNFENDTEKDRLQEMIENLNALNFIKYPVILNYLAHQQIIYKSNLINAGKTTAEHICNEILDGLILITKE